MLRLCLVERDEDPAFGEGTGQDLLVARVRQPVTGPDDAMPCGAQRLNGAAPHA
jgi:hypothetical protein